MPSLTQRMTVQEALRDASKRLQPRRMTCAADQTLGRLDAEILLAHVLKKNRAWLLAHGDVRLTTYDMRRFNRLGERRQKHEPIAYLLGEKEFYGLRFTVNRHVLIPRPETELLVELMINVVRARRDMSLRPLTIWDVGTGSGCVAIALAKYLSAARVLATDVSPAALTLARRNAASHRTKNVTLLKANLLDARMRLWLDKQKRALIIVANLPYLPASDKKKLAKDIVNYEPHDALFAGTTGREIIEKFLRQLAAFDIHFSSAFLELDPPQAHPISVLAKKLFPRAKIKIHKDMAGRQRVLQMTLTPP